MSVDPLSAAGALLLGAATLPQAWRLWRERSAAGFGWPFVALNLAGLVLLAVRSWQLAEWAFVAVNALGAGFWALALAIKVAEVAPKAPKAARRAVATK